VKQYFLQKPLKIDERYGKGSYVAITGGAGGLGLEYADQFASHGFNLLLIDMNDDGLNKAKEQVESKHKDTKIETLICNLAEMKSIDDYHKVMKSIDHLDISIMINNAGFMDSFDLHEARAQGVCDIIEVHCIALAVFSKLFYERFRKREKKSAIINVSSLAGRTPTSLSPMYNPTKAFVRYFTEGIANETGKEVDYLIVSPGAVKTAFSLNRKANDTCEPSVTIKGVLTSLGQQLYTSGWWMHEFSEGALGFVWGTSHDLYSMMTVKFFETQGIYDMKKQMQENERKRYNM
jgi:short-subunit dehydrogenase